MSLIKLVSGEDIRRLRKMMGLTQKKLAKKAGVSQSLIARIEKNSVDPRLSTVRKILGALSLIKEGKIAKDVMHSPVITIKSTDIIRKAVELMRKHNISQLPVLKEKFMVGSVKESTIIHRITRGGNIRKVFFTPIYNIMENPFITINPSMGIDEVLSIMSSGHPAVLVIDRGTLVGIITKIDVLASTIRFDEG
ncbi:CBS domain-containing protein [Candidatus Bathyarchaeota archaeon]|jgi:predicted transcriptional regulator|nr:CBS domain-containing protein [Candidatus Bathyarchaeota archaeon]